MKFWNLTLILLLDTNTIKIWNAFCGCDLCILENEFEGNENQNNDVGIEMAILNENNRNVSIEIDFLVASEMDLHSAKEPIATSSSFSSWFESFNHNQQTELDNNNEIDRP